MTAPFSYRFPLSALIRAAKFERDLAAVEACAELLRLNVSIHSHEFDAIVPVPLGRHRYRARGFNQAALMAAPLALGLGLPLRAQWVRRVADREAQSKLDAQARRANVQGVFALSGAVAQQRVLLVDDVVTTGATLSELARVLRAGGARDVHAVALAYRALD